MATQPETSGFFAWLGDSVRAHLDERIKSPFAGAFAIAWLAVNWQAILILLFSNDSIEDRIEVVVAKHAGWYLVVVLPVLYAIGIALAFYLLSAAFLVIAELYGMARAAVERSFDNGRWKSPAEFMQLKKKYLDKIQGLQELASDNLSDVTREQERANAASDQLVEVQKELVEQKAALARVIDEKSQESQNALAANQRRAEVEVLLNRLQGSHSSMRDTAKLAVSEAEDLKQVAHQSGVQSHAAVWNQILTVERITRNLAEQVKTAGQVQ